MANRLPILGNPGSFLSSRENGWTLVLGRTERALGFRILTEEALRSALGARSVRLLADAIIIEN
jgi:hypothetical protein